MRRWVWSVLLAAMAIAMLTVGAAAAETEGLKWEPDGSNWKVTGYTGTDKAVVIPARHEGGLVTGIGDKAFAVSSITSVEIPGTVTTIGEQAFMSCDGLLKVTFRDSVLDGEAAGKTQIRETAFMDCARLSTLILSDSVDSIGKNAFVGCTALKELVVPDGVSSIGSGAFAGCTGLTKVAISGDKTAISVEANAFTPTTKLKVLHYQGDVKFLNQDPDPDKQAWKADTLHEAVIVVSATAPTCTNGGKVSRRVICGDPSKTSACDIKSEETTAALGHDFQPPAGYVTPDTHPECEDWTETYEGICSRCQAKKNISVGHPATKRHDFANPQEAVTKPATCTEDGVKTITKACQNPKCDKTQVTTERIPKDPDAHDWDTQKEEILLEATCKDVGYKAAFTRCKKCGAVQCADGGWDHTKDEALNKKLAQGEFDTDYQSHLTAKHALDTIPVSTDRHTWGEWGWGYEHPAADGSPNDEPTCTEKGKETAMRECKVCGQKEFDKSKTRDVLPLGHDFDKDSDSYKEETVAATCTVDGKVTITGFCKRENTNVKVEEILPATGHNFVPISSSDPSGVLKEATCTEPGRRISGGERCTLCNEIRDSGEDIVLPPLGHLWSSPVIDTEAGDYKAPTCTEDGEGTGTVTCTRVGCHSDPDDPDSGPAVQTQKVKLPALGHDWGEWTVTKEATATEAGTRERTCKREGCGEKETREIPPLDTPVDPDNPDNPGNPDNPDDPDNPSTPEETTYTVDVVQASGGTTTVSRSTAKAGELVTVTVAPGSGYVLDMIRVIAGGSQLVSLTNLGSNQYRFTMPSANVEVRATYDRTGSDYSGNWSNGFGNSGSENRSDPRRTTDPVPVQIQEPAVGPAGAYERLFQDVPTDHWAAGEINWASQMGYMNGTGNRFNPDGGITQQQMWMVLARLTGNQPASMAEARRWAELGGYADGSSPTGAVKRHQLVTALYRCARLSGRAGRTTASLAGYPDSRTVPAVAREAFTWALTAGVVSGDAEGRLKPNDSINRAQFAVILYRYSTRT